MRKKKSQSRKKSESIAREWQKHEGDSDVLGSWTGTPDDGSDRPVQDADDL